ncbi:GD12841 [Drosophila simulans]|uniref:GD12841 n=1 Tax=Drosophila simulans TaxID=7240 RepID=B4QPL6_DROSI|nr:GD12841 [Drosophila simulans]
MQSEKENEAGSWKSKATMKTTTAAEAAPPPQQHRSNHDSGKMTRQGCRCNWRWKSQEPLRLRGHSPVEEHPLLAKKMPRRSPRSSASFDFSLAR